MSRTVAVIALATAILLTVGGVVGYVLSLH
jgi:hypothetical protein